MDKEREQRILLLANEINNFYSDILYKRVDSKEKLGLLLGNMCRVFSFHMSNGDFEHLFFDSRASGDVNKILGDASNFLDALSQEREILLQAGINTHLTDHIISYSVSIREQLISEKFEPGACFDAVREFNEKICFAERQFISNAAFPEVKDKFFQGFALLLGGAIWITNTVGIVKGAQFVSISYPISNSIMLGDGFRKFFKW